MKNGYYWCDRCDENAYGRYCEHCHRAARWVDAPIFDRATLPAVLNLGRRRGCGRSVSDETAQEWFSRMRETVAHT